MKKLSVIMVLLFAAGGLRAQVFTGGNVSFNMDNGYYLDAAPIIGYKIKSFKAGLSPVASYSGYADFKGVYSYGARVFTEYTVYKGIFLHGEFGAMNTQRNDGTTSRLWSLSAPLGVGYEYAITDNIMAQGSVLWDVMHTGDSPGENPIIRGGIIYNF